MSEAILIGTRGWDHDAWQGGFYPAELPVEWRFCYYSNLLRAVLVPAEAWADGGKTAPAFPATAPGVALPPASMQSSALPPSLAGATPSIVAHWLEDSDAGFRFVLEPPPLASAAERAAFLRLIEPLASQTDGFLVSAAPSDPAQLDMLLAGLTRAHPVCVDLPAGEPSPELSALLAAHRVGRCWHSTPGMEEVEPRREQRPSTQGDAPAPGGALVVALSKGGTTLELRQTLEALVRWQEPGGRAALFFEGPGAAEAAQTARTLAELMGV
jgi:hypothetical protein